MKYLASSSFLFIVICVGTYFAVTKDALVRINPVVFACVTMLLLLPIALVISLLVRKDITRDVITRGSLLGGCLCAVTRLLTVALQYTSATATAFFPCLNGLLAAFFTRLVLRHPVPRLTWCAATLAILGMGLMTASTTISPDEWRGTLLAFLGSVTYTGYIFLFDRLLVGYAIDRPTGFWPVLGIQLLTMAAGALVMLLLFGDWHALHPEPRDLLALLYDGVFIILLPLLLAACLQRYVDPTSVAFIYLLEPVLGALVAFLYLHETFPLSMYVGQGLVLSGVLFQTALSVVPVHAGNGQGASSSTNVQHGHRTLRAWNSFGWRQQRGMLAGLVAILVLGGSSAALSRWTPLSAAPASTVTNRTTIVGHASFFSSGFLDTQISQGINDGLELDLEDIPPPPAGTAYYGWLLPDTEHSRSMPLLLGTLPFSRGSVHLRYLDPQHTDLLALSSRVLITAGRTHAPHINPFLDHSTWRYYGQIPQQPTSVVSVDSSRLLAHLRSLLTSAPSMPGGLRIWFLTTTRSVLEGASATRGIGGAEDPSFLRADLYRMLDELDGSAFVQQDVPVGTPLYADPQTVQVPLLQLEPAQNPPGYLEQIGKLLAAILHSPEATPEQRQIATVLSQQLTVVAAALQHVRQDARQLVDLSDVQIEQPAAESLVDDLVEQTSTAYSGKLNQQTGEREGGSLWIADQLERLAAMTIEGCTSALCTMASVAPDKESVHEQTMYTNIASTDSPRVRRKEMTMQVKTLLRLAFEDPELLPGVLMTPLLKASAGVPLQERVLFHQLHPLEAAIPELVLDQGEPILERKVLLQGIGSGISYLYTDLLIVPGVLPLHVSTRLLPGVEPLETIMQECRLPTFREIIVYGHACLGEIADQTVAEHFGTGLHAEVLYRTSLLYLNQRPQCATMRMTEMLPLACVAEQHGASVLDPQQFRTQPLS